MERDQRDYRFVTSIVKTTNMYVRGIKNGQSDSVVYLEIKERKNGELNAWKINREKHRNLLVKRGRINVE